MWLKVILTIFLILLLPTIKDLTVIPEMTFYTADAWGLLQWTFMYILYNNIPYKNIATYNFVI